jgi:hypothetical protein
LANRFVVDFSDGRAATNAVLMELGGGASFGAQIGEARFA